VIAVAAVQGLDVGIFQAAKAVAGIQRANGLLDQAPRRVLAAQPGLVGEAQAIPPWLWHRLGG
jgi:hypothetical protein